MALDILFMFYLGWRSARLVKILEAVSRKVGKDLPDRKVLLKVMGYSSPDKALDSIFGGSFREAFEDQEYSEFVEAFKFRKIC